jgi:hypothetical protein
VVVEMDQGIAGGARAARLNEAGIDDEFVVAERVITAGAEPDALRELFIGDGVVEAVNGAAVPGHVQPS